MKTFKLLYLVLILATVFNAPLSAQNWWKNGMRGEGPKVTKTLNLDNFNAVGLSLSADVYLKQGNSQQVTIEGQENIINNIVTDVSGNYWKIKFDRPVRNHDGIKIYITIPTLTKAYISGSGGIFGQTKFTGLNELYLGISGSGDLELDFDASSTESKISGSGDMKLGGSTNDLAITISGSGDISAYDLSAQSCNIRISGSGGAKVDVQENLEVRVSGSGDVYYEGRPRLSSKISGSGDVTSKGS